MPTLTTERVELALIDPNAIDPHPDNDKVLSEESCRGLAASMRAKGQLQPALVRPKGDRWEVVIGHRRRVAAKLLGIQLRCFVEDLSDEDALALMTADNEQHEAPDPMRQAAAVAKLLERPGWTLAKVAEALGRSPRWVARRAQLARLPQALRESLQDSGLEMSAWPIDWIEQLALIDPDRLEALLEDGRLHYISHRWQIEALVARETHILGKAPWDLADATLVPEAGPCTTCPRTSVRSPGLFEFQSPAERGEQGSTADRRVAAARCRDGACWAKKLAAHARAEIAEARAENPDLLVVRGQQSTLRTKDLGPGAVESWHVENLKGKAKGAVRALVVEDAGVQEVWVRPYGALPTAKPAAAAKARSNEKGAQSDAERLEASKRRIRDRRRAWIVDRVRARLEDEDAPTPAPAFVLACVAMFQVDPVPGFYSPDLGKDGPEAEQLAGNLEAWAAAVWPRLRRSVAAALSRNHPDHLERYLRNARWCAEPLSEDWAALGTAAAAAIPEPKWWATAPKRAKDPPSKAEKSSGKQSAGSAKRGSKQPPAAAKRGAKRAKGRKPSASSRNERA